MKNMLIIADDATTNYNELSYGNDEVTYIMVDNIDHAVVY